MGLLSSFDFKNTRPVLIFSNYLTFKGLKHLNFECSNSESLKQKGEQTDARQPSNRKAYWYNLDFKLFIYGFWINAGTLRRYQKFNIGI